jgi:hypothetical protein
MERLNGQEEPEGMALRREAVAVAVVLPLRPQWVALAAMVPKAVSDRMMPAEREA